jgi:hypothetical protein
MEDGIVEDIVSRCRVKQTIYKPPLPLKKMRNYPCYHNRNGKVKIYTKEEIIKYLEEHSNDERGKREEVGRGNDSTKQHTQGIGEGL